MYLISHPCSRYWPTLERSGPRSSPMLPILWQVAHLSLNNSGALGEKDPPPRLLIYTTRLLISLSRRPKLGMSEPGVTFCGFLKWSVNHSLFLREPIVSRTGPITPPFPAILWHD